MLQEEMGARSALTKPLFHEVQDRQQLVTELEQHAVMG